MPIRESTSRNTLVIGNQPAARQRAAIAQAWRTGVPEPVARLDFESLEGAWQLLGPKRWAILWTVAGQGPLAIREVARRAGRDVRAVHGDIRALHLSGVIDKTTNGKMVLPYDVIRLDFTFDTRMAA